MSKAKSMIADHLQTSPPIELQFEAYTKFGENIEKIQSCLVNHLSRIANRHVTVDLVWAKFKTISFMQIDLDGQLP